MRMRAFVCAYACVYVLCMCCVYIGVHVCVNICACVVYGYVVCVHKCMSGRIVWCSGSRGGGLAESTAAPRVGPAMVGRRAARARSGCWRRSLGRSAARRSAAPCRRT